MGTDSFGRFLGGYMDIYSTFQRLVAQNMERSLSTLNVPSRSDVLELSERLSSLEERLSSIESSINTLAEAVGHPRRLSSIESSINTLAEAVGHPSRPAAVTQLRPRRTRQPRSQPAGAK